MKTHMMKLMLAAAAGIALAGGIWIQFRNPDGSPVVSEQDQAKTAQALLAGKFNGPGYFTAPASGDIEADGQWVDAAEAWRQLPRVVSERKLTNAGGKELEHLIEQTTEEPPSRMAGEARINVSRLNLSLDKMTAK